VVTDASFEDDVLRSPLPVLLDCWAPWCGPCRTLAPVIDALARAYAGRVRVAKLNVDENPGVAARYAVQGIPTLLLFDGGHLRDRLVGAQPRAILEARLEEMLATGSPACLRRRQLQQRADRLRDGLTRRLQRCAPSSGTRRNPRRKCRP